MNISGGDNGIFTRILWAGIFALLLQGIAWGGLDPPHNGNKGIGCLSCHQMSSTYPKLLPPLDHTPVDKDDTLANNACWSCHNDTSGIPYRSTHSSLTSDNGYGNWTVECWVCHNQHVQEQKDYGNNSGYIRRAINLANIKFTDAGGNPLPGKTGIKSVVFKGQTGANSFADGDATLNGICEVCHTQTSHHLNSSAGDHAHYSGQVCITCHNHGNGFSHGGGGGTVCIDCHGASGSHGAHLTDGIDCFACHASGNIPYLHSGTDANGDGTYDLTETSVCVSCHNSKPVWGGTACLSCHEVSQGQRASIGAQLNGNSHHIQSIAATDAHCYQCHWEADASGKVTGNHAHTAGAEVDLVVYGAGARPATYTEGATAVAYTADGTRNQILGINKHCLGCHSDQNATTQPFGDGKTPQQYAWDGKSVDAKYSDTGTATWGKYNTTGKQSLTKAFSAHGNASANAGGNSVTITDTFVSAQSWPNTRANSVNIACYDCHNSHGSTVSGTTSSYASATSNGGMLKNTAAGKGGYSSDYVPAAGGSDAARNLYNPGADLCFDCHLSESAGETPWGYNTTFGVSTPVRGFSDYDRFGGTDQRKSHAGGHFGASTPLSTASGTPKINGLCTPCHDPHGVSPTLNQAYAVPMLKGTWMTSIYPLDGPPEVTGNLYGDYFAYPPQYHIDQNTLDSWNWASTSRISESTDQFAGLCLQCHPKAKIDADSSTLWQSMDRVHETVKGWGSNARHSFSCAKCHTVHTTAKLPRLMITNCLDSRHKGRLKNNANPAVSGSGIGYRDGNVQGSGNGLYPGGGESVGMYAGTKAFGLGIACHSGGGTFPDNQLWNKVTPWLDADNDDNFAYRINTTSPIRDCDDNNPSIYRATDRTCNGDNDGFIDATAGGTDCNDNNNAVGYVPGTCDHDNDGDIVIAFGGYDCDDLDPVVARADDGSCDSDSDGFIDWTAGGPDCLDNNANYTSMAGDGSCDGDGDGLFDATAGGTDCNDNDANIKAATDGSCDGDADGLIDKSAKANNAGMDCNDNDASIAAATDSTCDGDNDTYIDLTAGGTDCNDGNSAIHNAPDGTCDGDGDGIIDNAAKPADDYSVDCDDNNTAIKNPSDGNCDNDSDGFIDPSAFGSDCNDLNATLTAAADGTCDGDADTLYDLTAGGTDCDDAAAEIRAAPDSTCDGDADGITDWKAGGPDCLDNDAAHGPAADSTCDGDNDTIIDGTAGGTDCDDTNSSIRTAADGNCDGDGDGFVDPSAGGTDCDDTNNTIGYAPATCDADNDQFIALAYGGPDCLDTDPNIVWAADGTCDGDTDTFIDWTAGGHDCNDNNAGITPPCGLTGNSTGYTVNTLTDSTANWRPNMFAGMSVVYHVTQTVCGYGCLNTEHYSTRTVISNTGNTLTVDSAWDFTTGFTPKEYTLTLP